MNNNSNFGRGRSSSQDEQHPQDQPNNQQLVESFQGLFIRDPRIGVVNTAPEEMRAIDNTRSYTAQQPFDQSLATFGTYDFTPTGQTRLRSPGSDRRLQIDELLNPIATAPENNNRGHFEYTSPSDQDIPFRPLSGIRGNQYLLRLERPARGSDLWDELPVPTPEELRDLYRSATPETASRRSSLSVSDADAEWSEDEALQNRGGKKQYQRRQTTDAPPLMPDVQGVRGRSNYGDAFNDAVEAYHPFGSCIWGAIEIMTFHPLGTQQPLAGVRLARNGWTEIDIAKAQLYARDRHSRVNVSQKHGSLKHELNRNGRIVYQDATFTRARYAHNSAFIPTADYSAATYRSRHEYDFDAKTFRPLPPDTAVPKTSRRRPVVRPPPSLTRMAAGVVNWPQGQDAGIVTQAIQWAFQRQDHSLTVNDIPVLAQSLGFVAPAESNSLGWDQNAKNRIIPIVDGSAKYNT